MVLCAKPSYNSPVRERKMKLRIFFISFMDLMISAAAGLLLYKFLLKAQAGDPATMNGTRTFLFSIAFVGIGLSLLISSVGLLRLREWARKWRIIFGSVLILYPFIAFALGFFSKLQMMKMLNSIWIYNLIAVIVLLFVKKLPEVKPLGRVELTMLYLGNKLKSSSRVLRN